MGADLSFAGIDTAMRGLYASQEALNTANADITNANTPGYSREQVDLNAIDQWDNLGFATQQGTATASLGGGVQVSDISRIRNQFLDDQYRASNLTLSQQTTTNQYIQQIQGTFDEPSSNGIQAQLNSFYDAWNTLAANPTQASARGALLQTAQSLANSLNEASASLTSIRQQADSDLTTAVSQVNAMFSQIASLNKQISTAQGSGAQANSLLDQRDEILDKLSGYLKVQTTTQSNGEISVYIAGKSLVSGDQATGLQSSPNGELTFSNVTCQNSALSASDLGGKFGALLNVRDQLIGRPVVPTGSVLQNTPGGLLYQLDTMTNSLATAVNSLTEAGTTLNEAGQTVSTNPPGEPFFTINTSSAQFNTNVINAANIQVNPIFSGAGGLNLIPVGGPPSGGVAPGAGDNATATAVAALRTTLISDGTFGDPQSMGTYTANDLYTNMLTQLGAQGQAATNEEQNQQALVDQVNQQRQSTSGVSLDEEMANIIKFQHTYEASARLISTFNSMLDTVINNMGK